MDYRYNPVIEHLSNVQKTMGSIPSSGKKEKKNEKSEEEEERGKERGRRRGRNRRWEEREKEGLKIPVVMVV